MATSHIFLRYPFWRVLIQSRFLIICFVLAYCLPAADKQPITGQLSYDAKRHYCLFKMAENGHRKKNSLSSLQILLFSFHSLFLHDLQVYLNCEIWFYLFYKLIFILKSLIKMLHCTHPDVLCVKSFRLCTVDAFLSNFTFSLVINCS